MNEATLKTVYGNKVRVRACGVLIEGERILLVKHNGIGMGGYMWAPPGGGVEFGESLAQAIVREFKEETGLDVEVKGFLFLNEYIAQGLHAIELFFEVKRVGGKLNLGIDPETNDRGIMLSDLKFFSFGEANREGLQHFHSLFNKFSSISQIFENKGVSISDA